MRAAIDAGADYVGVVFAESLRQVDPDALEVWLEDARADCEVVGVFRDQDRAFVDQCVARFDLDLVQLHGSEKPDDYADLGVRLIESTIVAGPPIPPPRFPGRAWARLLDAGAGGGRPFDWDLAVAPARAERVFLAGGLTAESVPDAIRRVSPFAVDVSSGVERAGSAGRKDARLMRAFVAAVREASAP
jgi:phosphoribosylanthranilate isomerase